MRFRWPTKYLPSFPAVLLVPVVLAVWAGLCRFPRGGWSEGGYTFLESKGFPFVFEVEMLVMLEGGTSVVACAFWWGRLLIDVVIALLVAYMMAMAFDRLLFPMIRRRLRRQADPGEPN
ncbi:MAG: hypothetical protein O7H41_16125 [Planctomycetota bacterium]|nr:hypothetical protein [Planctomycetota bacterium]